MSCWEPHSKYIIWQEQTFSLTLPYSSLFNLKIYAKPHNFRRNLVGLKKTKLNKREMELFFKKSLSVLKVLTLVSSLQENIYLHQNW